MNQGSSSTTSVVQLTPNDMEVRSANHSNISVPSFQAFQKLPNPMSYLLKELPIVDGNDARLLCDFLVKVINISNLGQIKNPILYELLYPHCRGELLACLGQAISNHESFDTILERMLKRFIPNRQLTQLRFEYYERLQGELESLDTYVRAVREAAAALRIKENEAEVVARIVEGFNPNQPARLIFQAPPSTFLRLEQLGIVDRNITFTDNSRLAVAVTPAVNAVPQSHQHRSTKQCQVR